MEQQYGTGSSTAAQHMLDLVTGVAAHAAADPTIAAFGLAAGILRERPEQNAADVSGGDGGVIDAETCSLGGSVPDDSAASQQRSPGRGTNGGANGHIGAMSHPAAPNVELDPSFWQQQAEQHSRQHSAALQLLYGGGSTTFTRLPFDATRLVQPKSAVGAHDQQEQQLRQEPQEHQPQQHTGSAFSLPQLRPLRPVRDWMALAHPSAGGLLSELLAMPGMETALETLTAPDFVHRLQVLKSEF